MTTCQGPGCDRSTVALGLCDYHYRQRRKGRTLTPIPMPVNREPDCTFPGCGAAHFALGLCSGHYQQRAKGRPLTAIVRGASVVDRFWSRVDARDADQCWEWNGATTGHGYGNFCVSRGRWKGAHRFSYELVHGPVDPELVIDHLCRNRKCVNPAHLEAVPQRTNVKRGLGPGLARIQNVDQTYCKHGHPLFGENLYVQPKNGYRYCRTCNKRRQAEYQARKARRSVP